jgi:hypothetical protein
MITDFYGLSIKTMAPECMFAHKLCAITDRRVLQNRDLFDAHFMFKRGFDIDEEIIKLRTGKSVNEYIAQLIDYIIDQVKDTHILQGLGELLDEKQKSWVKNHLVEDLLFELKIRASHTMP